jgi:hypothetical protein
MLLRSKPLVLTVGIKNTSTSRHDPCRTDSSTAIFCRAVPAPASGWKMQSPLFSARCIDVVADLIPTALLIAH